MAKPKYLNRKFFNYILYFVVLSLFGVILTNTSYAYENIIGVLENQNKPNILMIIGENGKINYQGDLFDHSLWYPGKEASGVIRISNHYKNIKISNLGLKVDINSTIQELNKEDIYKSFIENMKLKISKGKLLIFSDVLYDNKFKGILFNSDPSSFQKGLDLNPINLTIDKNDSLDLKYTMKMDYEAGEELESLSSSVKFLISFK